MKDKVIEIISLLAIILGLTLGFFFIFDYVPVDSFFLEEDDNNAYLEGTILKKSISSENKTHLTVYGCKSFEVYSEIPVDKKVNESIFLQGSFSDELFILERYK